MYLFDVLLICFQIFSSGFDTSGSIIPLLVPKILAWRFLCRKGQGRAVQELGILEAKWWCSHLCKSPPACVSCLCDLYNLSGKPS